MRGPFREAREALVASECAYDPELNGCDGAKIVFGGRAVCLSCSPSATHWHRGRQRVPARCGLRRIDAPFSDDTRTRAPSAARVLRPNLVLAVEAAPKSDLQARAVLLGAAEIDRIASAMLPGMEAETADAATAGQADRARRAEERQVAGAMIECKAALVAEALRLLAAGSLGGGVLAGLKAAAARVGSFGRA